MRAGGSCTLQQALTPEAAALVKQAVTLAKRRGHGQVTPLHVAATMLTTSTGLLRTACLRSNSHPLQCKALELCFNVALNRLPAAASGPMFGIHGTGNSHHHHVPSISNALIAAFKRAQAHQRRGSIESNQSLLAVKIELDQLVISILDDPSVSRVMKEAGFSSSQVKSNVEHVVLSETSSQSTPSPVRNTADINSGDMNLNNMQSNSPHVPASNQNWSKQDHSNLLYRIRDEDVMHVIENLMEKRKRSIVIVGENSGTTESVATGLTEKLRNGSLPDDVARTFKGVQFIDLSLPSFEYLSREGFEHKLGEVMSYLRRNHIHTGNDNSNGAILFLGDLGWIAENRANARVEHWVAELGKLIHGFGEDKRVWVMGIATLQSYMRCKSGSPSLESIWRLHPVAVPVGSLSFSLITDSNVDSGCSLIKKSESRKLSSSSSWLLPLQAGSRQHEDLSRCDDDRSMEFEKESWSSWSSSINENLNRSPSSLPPWLQQYKDEKNRPVTHRDADRDYSWDLRTRCNSICNSIHGEFHSSETALKFSSPTPSPSSSGFPYELSNCDMNLAKRARAEYSAWTADQSKTPNFNSNPSPRNSPIHSGSSSDDITEIEYFERFKELSGRDMRVLIQRLEEKVPRQKHIIPEIAISILRCRSGMAKRKINIKELDDGVKIKNDTWFLFQGPDRDGKQKTARELAGLVHGSYDSLVTISISSQTRDKRSSCGFEEFAEAVSDNPHRVFLIEDVAEADCSTQEHFKRAIERGRVVKSSREEVDLKDAIIILCSRSLTSRSTVRSPTKQMQEDEEKETNPSLSLDLNISIAGHGGSGTDDHRRHPNSVKFTEYVDKVIHFEIHEL